MKEVLLDIESIPEMKLLDECKKNLQQKIVELEEKLKLLLLRRRGGSKKGRKIIKRNFEVAYEQVFSHYFADRPLYSNQQFIRRYRVSRFIFDRVYNACLRHEYFQHRCNAADRWGIHPLVKVTAVFRQLAYGCCADALDEHFQISQTTLETTKELFCDIVIKEFGDIYLPSMSKAVASHLIQKHAEVGWPGLLGSLDCCHWEWGRCPKSLHGEFKKGIYKRPTIVYECLADCNLRIWHAAFAAPGSNNDLNVLDVSKFLFDLASGETLVPFVLDGTEYRQPYVLVDGIYPEWACFVKPLSNPITEAQKNYTKRQEARRKDVERAFGCLLIKFNILNKPSLTTSLALMEKILLVCCILHNMVVEEKENKCASASVADVVYDEALDSDQTDVGESELTKIERSSLDSLSAHLKYLKNAQTHITLRTSVMNHLWSVKILESHLRFQSAFGSLVAR